MSHIVSIDTSSLCLQSYPCQHTVTIYMSNGTKQDRHMDGVSIYELFLNNNLHIPQHFVNYADHPNRNK